MNILSLYYMYTFHSLLTIILYFNKLILPAGAIQRRYTVIPQNVVFKTK